MLFAEIAHVTIAPNFYQPRIAKCLSADIVALATFAIHFPISDFSRRHWNLLPHADQARQGTQAWSHLPVKIKDALEGLLTALGKPR